MKITNDPFKPVNRLTKENIVGRQYGYRSSALRAIRRVAKNPNRYGVNQIDEGCYEIVN